MKNQNLKKLEEFRFEIRKNQNQKLFEQRRIQMLKKLQTQSTQFQCEKQYQNDSDLAQLQQELIAIIRYNQLQKLSQVLKKIQESLKNNQKLIQQLLKHTKIPELIMEIYNNLISQINTHVYKQKCIANIIKIFAELSKSESLDQNRILDLELIEMIKYSFTEETNILLMIISILCNKVSETKVFQRVWNANLLYQLLEMLETKNVHNTKFQSYLMWFLNNFFMKAKQIDDFGLKLRPEDLNITFDFCQKILSNHYYYLYEDKNPQIICDAVEITKILIHTMKLKRYPSLNAVMDLLISENIQNYLGRYTIQSALFIVGHLIYLQDQIGKEIVRNSRFFYALSKQKIRFKNIWIQIMANLATIVSLHKCLEMISSQIIEDILLVDDKNERLLLFRYVFNWFTSKNYKIYESDYPILQKLSNNHIPYEYQNEEDSFWVKILDNGYNGPIPQYLIQNDSYPELKNLFEEKRTMMR